MTWHGTEGRGAHSRHEVREMTDLAGWPDRA
jgi:hypothetical protein